MKPKLAITMGDPAGVGPEIVIKALSDKRIYEICRPVVIGNINILEKIAELIGYKGVFNKVESVEDAKFKCNNIDVFDIGYIDLNIFEPAKISFQSGKASYEYIKKAIELAIEGQVDATVTAPINKESLNLTQYKFSGHTEIYAKLTGSKDYAMMLIHNNLRVIHVSTHVSLKEAIALVNKNTVIKKIRLADKTLKKLGFTKPKIAVAGLNPHCGENGLFGMEEVDEIIPAIKHAKKEGIDAIGPIAADTVFSKAYGGLYDVVVAMYHDQGHIPLKVLGFVWDKKKQEWKSVSGVNITLGLPIIRCSVDHGTAYDIAWKGKASEESLLSAIEYATKLSERNK